MEQKKYRPTAGIVLQYDKKVFFGLTPKGYWGMPQGGIEKGETPQEAAARELLEETGISEVEWVSVSGWYLIHLPEIARINNKRYSKIHTQKYQWFLAKVHSEPKIVLSHEYLQYHWISPKEVMEALTGSFKKEMYQSVFEEFKLL